VSAESRNGFDGDPEACVETIRQAARGGSSAARSNATGRSDEQIYPFAQAVERVAAAVAAASAPDYVLAARAAPDQRQNHLSTRFAGWKRSRPPAPTCCTPRA
jgi:2-methylisocitrate lyase-like PEP mutase family enzyme